MLKIADIPRATLICVNGREQECTADLFAEWLESYPGDRLKEAARTVGALCDVIRQLRNDYDWEYARAERALAEAERQARGQ